MSPRRKNVVVGTVVLASLIILAWMLIQFGGSLMLPFATAKLRVRFVADRADGISNGSAVVYRGVSVGQVETIARAPDQLRVYIEANIDKQPPLPGNLRASIRSQGLIGSGAALVLETTDAQPTGQLQPGQEIPTHFVGLEILPPEFSELAGELRATAKQLRESNIVAHLDEQIAHAGKLIESIESLTADPKLRQDLTQSMDNIRSASEKADRITTNIEKFSGSLDRISTDAEAAVADVRVTINTTQEQIVSLSKQTGDSLQRMSKLLDQFQSIAEKVDKGKGTAGAMVNDPRLYENLVETARQMNATVLDLKRLIEQWEQEGVSIKMK